MDNKRNNPQNMQPLLNEAARRLGTTPEALAKKLNGGDLAGIMKNMAPQQQAALNKALSDKEACERLLNSPQAQALMKKLSGR